MGHSEVYLNKYVVSIAPFSTPACPDCSQNMTENIENCSFCMFSLFNFSSIFQGSQLTPFAPVYAECGRPCFKPSVRRGQRNEICHISETVQDTAQLVSAADDEHAVVHVYYDPANRPNDDDTERS